MLSVGVPQLDLLLSDSKPDPYTKPNAGPHAGSISINRQNHEIDVAWSTLCCYDKISETE